MSKSQPKLIYQRLDNTLYFIAEKQPNAASWMEFVSSLWSYLFSLEMELDLVYTATEDDKALTETYLNKLKNDGYINTEEAHRPTLTVEGAVFLYSKKIWGYQYKPYQYQSYKSRLAVVWKVVGVIAAILNALAILYLGWLQLHITGH